ncbi:MAG: pilus assembly protein PilM [Thermodesulfobacteriota bacterium]|nr:pilus assembly protein PilM [Thermodesulfobacteriota bacterium]
MLFQTSIGIDIGNDYVSIVYLKASFKGIQLVAHAVHRLEKDKAVQEKLRAVKDIVRDFLTKNRIRSTDIFVGIPRGMSVLRYAEFPLTVKDNLRETLGYEMEKYVPFSPDEVYFDYQLVEEDKEKSRLKVFLVTVKKESLEPYLDLSNQLDIGISGIEIGCTAMSNFFSHKENQYGRDPFVFGYLEDDNLEINVVSKGILSYSKSLRLPDDHGDFSGIIARELGPLRETLTKKNGRLEVILCGDGPDIEQVNQQDIETGIALQPVDLSRIELPSYNQIPAYGIALKGIRKVPMDINLLPQRFRKKAGKTGYYAMFGLAGLLILSIVAWGGGHLIRQRLYLDQLNQGIKQLGTEVHKIEQRQKKCNEIEKRIGFLNDLTAGHVPFLKVIKDLTEKIPETAWLTRFTFTDKGIQIKGYADAASELVTYLDASPLFKDVVFLSPITKGRNNKERFRIGFKLS